MKKIALIPCYEPDNKLIKLLEKLYNKMDIVVIDDGSGTEYKDIFKEAEKFSYVISYDNNKGKGYALKKGIKYIKSTYKEDYIIITMDCDGQHSVDDVLKLSNYVEKNPDTLVLGKRLRDSTVPIRSKIGNTITKFIYRVSTGIDIYDTQTGLRAFSNKLTNYMLSIYGNRYEYEMNVLLYLNRNNIKYKEITIKTIYINNNESSHFNAIKDSFRVYREIIRFASSSIISFIIDYVLYTVLFLLSKKIILSNTVARLISASVNYNLNKKMVFKYNKKESKSLFKYILLAVAILICNTFILGILSLFMNSLVAKIITEIILFFINYFVQKNIIFMEEYE